MGKPIPSNFGISRHESIVAGGERGELKHLSTFRKRNQIRDSLSSGERKGNSLNPVYAKACERCMQEVAGFYWRTSQRPRGDFNSIVEGAGKLCHRE
jgi:hypothetical protein